MKVATVAPYTLLAVRPADSECQEKKRADSELATAQEFSKLNAKD